MRRTRISALPGRGQQAPAISRLERRGDPSRARSSTTSKSRASLAGLTTSSPSIRLFMAPGMQHCESLGLGPNAVGGVFGLPSPSRDPTHDVVAALAHWVEDGEGSRINLIIATNYRDNDPPKGVVAQRPWCAYPAVARYSGQGDRDDAASYACTPPAK